MRLISEPRSQHLTLQAYRASSQLNSEEQDTAPPNTDVRHNRSRNKSVRSTNATIKNRVAAPVSNMPTHHDAMQQEAMAGSTQPQTEVELTPTVPVERPVDTPVPTCCVTDCAAHLYSEEQYLAPRSFVRWRSLHPVSCACL